ncbi:MAG: FkbM family methyltransferase [Lysobacterales bacterium]
MPMKKGACRLARKMRPVLPYGILANLLQWLRRDTHEADFEIFEWLIETDGLVLDVGASRGQSAISILRRTRRMRVLSFEPNRKHRWSLLLIRLLHPSRFSFRLIAAGDVFSRGTLHVPGRRASGLSAQGSLDPAEFEKDYVHQRLSESGFDASDKSGYRLLSVDIVPLDSFELAPDLIKLDVEGFEQQALKGLEKTLVRHQPVLLIEINNPQRWLPFLQALGYDFYRYDPSSRSLRNCDDRTGVLIIFCLNRNSDSLFTDVLKKKCQT